MKRTTWRVLVGCALASVFQVAVLAGETRTVAHEEGTEAASLRTEIDALRGELHTRMTSSYDDKKTEAAPAADCGCGYQAHCGCGGCDCCQSCCNAGGSCGCFEPCCHCPGWWASAELIWFKYHRADGVRTGDDERGDDAEFDLEITPRLTVGYVGTDGLGARIRYWDHDHDAPDNDAGFVNVDTYTLDFEVFDTFCLNRNWDLELAAGIRYNDFEEFLFDDEGAVDFARVNRFEGFGIIVGAELRRLVGTSGAAFVRARGTILMDNKDVLNVNLTTGAGQNVELIDVVVGTTELAFGYDYISPIDCSSYYFLRLQAEWQTWYNYSSSFNDVENGEDVFDGPSDVGFAGIGVAVGVAR